MAFPDDALTNQWVDGEALNAAKLYARIDARLNSLATGKLSPAIKQVQRVGSGLAVADSTFVTIVGYNTNLVSSGSGVPTHSAGVFTIIDAGVYEVSSYIVWPLIAGAHRTLVRILLNGAQTPDGLSTAWYPSGTNGQTAQRVVSVIPCSVGDAITAQLWQDSGSSVTTATDGAVYAIKQVA